MMSCTVILALVCNAGVL